MKKLYKILIIALIMLSLLSLRTYAKNENISRIKVTFNSAIDGDTAKFNYNNEILTVRFLAIDTPETKHPKKGVEPYGKEASEYTKEKLIRAKEIVLEYDNNSDKTDKYNRHLAWVWVDGELLQCLLLEQGLAKIEYIYGDYKYLNYLQQIEEISKENKIGIWRQDNKIEEEADNSNTIEINSNENIAVNYINNNLYVNIILVIIMLLLVSGILFTINKRRKQR